MIGTVIWAWFAPVLLGQTAEPYSIPLARPVARQPGVLLLRNGQVLAGQIAQSEDRYSILVARGEVRIPQREVECLCGSLEEAYEHRRRQTDADSIQGHLDLADWCLTNRLLAHAGEELRLAATLNPNHPLVPLLERKIRMAVEQQTMPAERAPAATAPPGEVSSDELDRMVRGLPSGSVEMFTQTIQPMLVNTCATAGCHGPASQETFHLLRVSATQPASRRLTQRNLHTVAKLIRWDNPADSPLLTVPIQPHGNRVAPIFSDRQMDQYQQLVRWVHLVVLGKKIEPDHKAKGVVTAAQAEEPLAAAPAVTPASFEASEGDGLPLGNGVLSVVGEVPSEPARSASGAIRHEGLPWGGELPGDTAFSGEKGAGRGAETRRAVTAPARGTAAPASQGRRRAPATPEASADPFDPAQFNRRFGTQPPAAPGDAQ